MTARATRPDPSCPLCADPGTELFLEAREGRYHRCPSCALRFLDPADRLDRDAEHAHYRQHDNRIEDPGYRRFLSRLADPLRARMRPGAAGLDYGCGPGPALAAMLEESGHRVSLYDPLFAPDRQPLNRTYAFVTCTETVEHFHDPAAEFTTLFDLVLPGGLLAVMTCFQTDDARFERWHYRMDPTHVCFYRRETFAWLARQAGWGFESPTKDVVFLRRPG